MVGGPIVGVPLMRCGDRFYNILLYEILLACVVGGVIGYAARKVLRFAEERK